MELSMKTNHLFRRAHGLAIIACGTILAAAPAAVFGETTIYNNTNAFSGYGYQNGLAASISGVDTTRMVADDIAFAPGSAGMTINELSFSAVNFGSSATDARVRIGLWSDDGAGGGPGTYLFSAAFPVSLSAYSVSINTLLALSVTVPADGNLWAGEWFDNFGTSATPTALDSLGVGIYNPPAFGSSLDLVLIADGPGFVEGNNPAGSTSNFGGTPVANLGFAFNAVPEPTSIALGMLGGLAWLQARRTRHA